MAYSPSVVKPLHALVETPDFVVDAKGAGMTEAEIQVLAVYLAANPLAGEPMVGTGGARKLRWRRPGTGKSGGYRVITYFGGEDVPIFLLNVFVKGEKANLSKAERNSLRDILATMAAIYREGVERNVKGRRTHH